MRNDAREAAYQVVFSRLLGGDLPGPARTAMYNRYDLNEGERAYSERLIAVVAEKNAELSAIISGAVTRFADYRIYSADRAALLIALAEIKYFDDIPTIVSVSEATALARKFSTERSADFVNGVLGGIINA